MTWRRVPAPVRRGMLPGGSYHSGPGPAPPGELTGWMASGSMERSAGYARCGPSASPGHRGWDERCNCTRRRLYCSRPAPGSRVRPSPGTGNAAWWWSTGWHGWSNWESAKSRYFGRVKTKFQLYLAATVANLTLLAAKAGLTGETGSGPSDGSAQVAGMVNSATAWLGQIWTLSLLVSALLTKSLFPTRGFRPGF